MKACRPLFTFWEQKYPQWVRDQDIPISDQLKSEPIHKIRAIKEDETEVLELSCEVPQSNKRVREEEKEKEEVNKTPRTENMILQLTVIREDPNSSVLLSVPMEFVDKEKDLRQLQNLKSVDEDVKRVALEYVDFLIADYPLTKTDKEYLAETKFFPEERYGLWYKQILTKNMFHDDVNELLKGCVIEKQYIWMAWE